LRLIEWKCCTKISCAWKARAQGLWLPCLCLLDDTYLLPSRVSQKRPARRLAEQHHKAVRSNGVPDALCASGHLRGGGGCGARAVAVQKPRWEGRPGEASEQRGNGARLGPSSPACTHASPVQKSMCWGWRRCGRALLSLASKGYAYVVLCEHVPAWVVALSRGQVPSRGRA